MGLPEISRVTGQLCHQPLWLNIIKRTHVQTTISEKHNYVTKIGQIVLWRNFVKPSYVTCKLLYHVEIWWMDKALCGWEVCRILTLYSHNSFQEIWIIGYFSALPLCQTNKSIKQHSLILSNQGPKSRFKSTDNAYWNEFEVSCGCLGANKINSIANALDFPYPIDMYRNSGSGEETCMIITGNLYAHE